MPRVTSTFGICALILGLSGFYGLSHHSANTVMAKAIMGNAEAIQAGWGHISTSFSIDSTLTDPGALAPVLEPQYNALDWVVYGEHVMTADYKEEFKRIEYSPLMEGMHITAPNGELHYGVGGARLMKMTVLADGTTAIFYREVFQPVIESLLALYDPKPFNVLGDDTGIVRYGKLDGHEYALGIYLMKHQEAQNSMATTSGHDLIKNLDHSNGR
jgi:hypothetical protein